MALEDEVRRTNELLNDLIRKGGGAGLSGGTSGGSSGKAYTEAERAASSLANSLKEAKASFQNLQRTSKDYGTVSKLNNVAHNLFGKSTLEAQEHMEALGDAIYQQQQVYRDAKKAGNEEVAGKARATLMNLQQQKANNEVNAQAARALGSSVGGLISTFAGLENELIKIEAAYQANLMQMVSQGATGFSMFGAAVEANIDKVTAASDAMANAAQQAGSALGQMGGVILPIVGFALNLMAERAKAVTQANATLAKQGIRILVEEGNKLIKTHMAMTGAGLVFANGMQGMINATDGTKLRLEEMTKVVVDHKEALVSSGLGIGQATQRVGAVAKMFASTTGKFAHMDRQLLALGFSYEEQAGMAAETLGEMRRGAGGQNVTNAQVAQTTAEYAKNLALLKSLSDEDVKGKMDQRKKENMELAFELQMAKMTPDQRAKIQAGMAKMTDLEARNLRERMVYGSVINKQGAIMEAQSGGVKAAGEEYYKQLKNNAFSVETVANTQARLGPRIAKDIERSGQAIGMAAMAGKGDVGDAAKGLGDMYRQSQKTTAQAVKEGKEAIDKQTQTAAKPTKAGDPTAALLDAIEVGATAAKEMQQKVVNVIGDIAVQLKKHYDGLKGAFEARNYTGDMAGGGMPLSMEQILMLMIALPIVRGLMMGGFTAAMNKVKTGSWLGKIKPDAPPPTPTTTTTATNTARPLSAEAQRAKDLQAKNPGMSRADALAESRRIGDPSKPLGRLAETEAKIAQNLARSGPAITNVANEASTLSKGMSFMKGGFQKLGTKIPLIGTALTVAMAGFNIAGIEARQAAGEITAEQARIEEGGAVGSAAGGLSGGIAGAAAGAAIGSVIPVVGTVIGGLIGGAIGAWGGEELGSYLGESLMSHWGDITEWTSKFGKSISDGWTTAKNWLATDGKQYWNMFTSGAKEVGSMALGLLEQMPVIGGIVKGAENLFAAAGKKFDSAGKTIRGFLEDSAAKFKQTFPELTAGVEKVVGGMKSGLGSLYESISEKAAGVIGYIKEKTGFGNKTETPKPAAPAQPAAPPGTAPTNTSPAKSTPPAKVDVPGVPQKKELTAQEKAAIYETIATNTKYTNDLMQAQQRAINSMLQQLAAIAGNTNDTAVAAKKTAQRVN